MCRATFGYISRNKVAGGESIVRMFEDVGASSPVKLTLAEKQTLQVLLRFWLDEADVAGGRAGSSI